MRMCGSDAHTSTRFTTVGAYRSSKKRLADVHLYTGGDRRCLRCNPNGGAVLRQIFSILFHYIFVIHFYTICLFYIFDV